jgi:putative spermidine/putrescine transport system ATP-binding protein
MVGPSSQAAAAVQFVGVSKTYGTGLTAIDALDLKIQPGEFLTLLGPSGSGKTTALNLLAGFQIPTAGRILVDGNDIAALPPYRRNIGVVFQHYALFPHMTVRENIAYPLRQRKLAKGEIAAKVDEAIRMVSLGDFADRLPRQLSGGQQQRVAVARAIVFRPRLLLMDEPLGALDRKLRETVQLELKRLHRELGMTVVFVTHDQDEALVMSDRIAIFDAGRIQQIGTAEELYDQPVSRFVAQFLGESNCFVGDIVQRDGAYKLNCQEGLLSGLTTAATPTSGRAAMVIRPERCKIFSAGQAPAGWNLVPARIREVVYLGSQRKVIADCKFATTAVVNCTPDDELPSSPEVVVAFPPAVARIVSAS